MTPADGSAVPPIASPAGADEPASLLQTVQSLWRDLPGLLSDRVHLLALELKRAGMALAMMLGLVVGAAVLVATAWLALWVGIANALLEAGLAWGWVFLIVLLLNLGGAAFALLRAKSMAHLLTLPATVRRLTVTPTLAPMPRSSAAAATTPPTHEHVRSSSAPAVAP